MKLSNWAKKQGISYITAWRWFNEGKLPVKAYRSDSGTIIVQDESESSEQVMVNPQSNDVMSMVLKKTVEFSKNNGTVEDFAAWVLSTFSLKFNLGSDSPKYSRVKPKPEDVQKHFQQFLKGKGEKPKLGSFVASEETLEEIVKSDGLGDEAKLAVTLEMTDDTAFIVSADSEFNTALSELFITPLLVLLLPMTVVPGALLQEALIQLRNSTIPALPLMPLVLILHLPLCPRIIRRILRQQGRLSTFPNLIHY
jgi:hypothetical protein